jgi:hypothetical protein
MMFILIRIFAIFYILTSVCLLSYGISILGSITVERAVAKKRYERLHHKLDLILMEMELIGLNL